MRNYILFNPLAGHGDHESQIEAVKKALDGETVVTDIREIESYKDFMLALNKDDKIILCGGDGTINRFANESGYESYENEIYYFAMGSGNDFLHDIDGEDGTKPFSINKFLKNLPTVTVKGKDYKFINGVGYGIDGYCCEVGDKLKAQSKAVNYTMIAIKGLLFHYKPTGATVTVDGKEYRYEKVWIAPTMNGRYYGGGMMPTPNQNRLNPEGTVSVMLFHGTSKLKTLMIFPSIFKGEHVKHTEAIAIHEGKDITVKFDKPTSLQIDGETILDVSEYTVHAGVKANIAN